MLDTLLMLLPDCKRWYELFGGSCAVTLNSKKHAEETVNEKNKDMWCLLKVMQEPELFKGFIKELWVLEYNKETFLGAKEMIKQEGLDEVKRALCKFILITQSYNNLGQNFSKKDARKYVDTNVYNAYCVHERLQGLDIQNRDALELLEKIRGDRDAFVFLDPPYLHRYRGKGADKAYGDYEMTNEMHESMLRLVKNAECKIMICGYRSQDGEPELYDRELRKDHNNWQCYLLTDIHKPNNGGERAREYVWVNYELPVYAEDYIIIKDVIPKNK